MMIANVSIAVPNKFPKLNYVTMDDLKNVNNGRTLLDLTAVKNLHASVPIKQFRWFCHRPIGCLLYTSPSPRDKRQSRMPSSA